MEDTKKLIKSLREGPLLVAKACSCAETRFGRLMCRYCADLKHYTGTMSAAADKIEELLDIIERVKDHVENASYRAHEARAVLRESEESIDRAVEVLS